ILRLVDNGKKGGRATTEKASGNARDGAETRLDYRTCRGRSQCWPGEGNAGVSPRRTRSAAFVALRLPRIPALGGSLRDLSRATPFTVDIGRDVPVNFAAVDQPERAIG